MTKVKRFYIVWLVLLATVCCGLCQEVEAFSYLDGESGSCENHCIQAVSKTDQAVALDVKACKRGCRLFGICEWVSSNLTNAHKECTSACVESYQDESKSKQDACLEGCNAALPLSQQRHSKMAMEASRMHSMFSSQFSNFNDPFEADPFQSIDDMMNGFMESAMAHFSSIGSFMVFPSSSQIIDITDGVHHEIIIMEVRNPEINTPHPRGKKVMLNTDSNGFKTTLKDHVESNLQNYNKKPSLLDAEFSLDYSDEDWRASDGYLDRLKERSRDWWDCFTRRAGLPELVLLLFWISTSMLLVMTCLAQFHSQPNKLSINGDLAYISDNKGKLPPYMQAYPCPENGKKSPYFIASVVSAGEEKVPLTDDV